MRGTTDDALSLCMVYVSGPEISSLKFKRKTTSRPLGQSKVRPEIERESKVNHWKAANDQEEARLKPRDGRCEHPERIGN